MTIPTTTKILSDKHPFKLKKRTWEKTCINHGLLAKQNPSGLEEILINFMIYACSSYKEEKN